MKNVAEVKVRGVEEGRPFWIALHHTVVTLRLKHQGDETRLDIPVECLRVARKKRVNALWVALFLVGLVLGPVAGIALALGASRVFSVDPEPNRITVPIVVAFLLPAAYFFFRAWRRDPVAEFAFGEEKHQRFSFWLPLNRTRREAAEALLVAIEAVRPETSGRQDQPVVETDESASPLGAMSRYACLTLLFCIPAISTERVWLFALGLIPLLFALAAGVRWLRTPRVLRAAVRLTRQKKWEEALRCLEQFEAETPDGKGACLMERLTLLRRLGRFNDACDLVEAHLPLIGPEAHRMLLDDLDMGRRMRQRKSAQATGGWFLTH